MARMEAGYDLNLEQRQWVSPSLIEANYILSLSRQELEAVINQELDSNPALEVSEEQVCPRCGGALGIFGRGFPTPRPAFFSCCGRGGEPRVGGCFAGAGGGIGK